MPGWVSGDPVTYAPLPVNGYSLTGAITSEPAGPKRRITVDVNVTRTGPAGVIDFDDWANFGAVLPEAVRGPAVSAGGPNPKYLPVAILSPTTAAPILAAVFLNPNNGLLQIRGLNKFTWNPGALFSLECRLLHLGARRTHHRGRTSRVDPQFVGARQSSCSPVRRRRWRHRLVSPLPEIRCRTRRIAPGGDIAAANAERDTARKELREERADHKATRAELRTAEETIDHLREKARSDDA